MWHLSTSACGAAISDGKKGAATKQRLVIGTALSAELLPEGIGRPAMVEKVADGVRAAMRDAGIDDPKDVHYVQTKTPLLTIDSVRDAESRGYHVACEVHDSMGVSNGTTALGIALALGEIDTPRAEEIYRNLDLYSSVASCSSGVELTQAQIVLLGNKAGAGGRYRIGHAVMRDALDMDGIYDAVRNAGLTLPERPRPHDLDGRVVNCFIKCEADRRGSLRGRLADRRTPVLRPANPRSGKAGPARKPDRLASDKLRRARLGCEFHEARLLSGRRRRPEFRA